MRVSWYFATTPKKQMKSNKGFLLVEILVAISIFTAFVGFTSYFFSQIAQIVHKNVQINNQTCYAQNILDELLACKKIVNQPNLIITPLRKNLTKITYSIDQKHKIELIHYEN